MSNEETIPDTPQISKLKFRLKKLKRGDKEESDLLEEIIALGHDAKPLLPIIISKAEQGVWEYCIFVNTIWRVIINLKSTDLLHTALNAGFGIHMWDQAELLKNGFSEMENAIAETLWNKKEQFSRHSGDPILGTHEAIETLGDYGRLCDTLELLRVLDDELCGKIEKMRKEITDLDIEGRANDECVKLITLQMWLQVQEIIHEAIGKLEDRGLVDEFPKLEDGAVAG